MLDLSRWEGFHECVSNHVIGRAVNKLNRAIFDDVFNEVKVDVNVFGASMVLVIFGEGHGRLIVRKKGGRVEFAREDLCEEGTKPKCFRCCMSNSNILALSGREGDDLLLFSAPRNSSPIKYESVP